jgi:hypothetical protein
MKIYLAARYSRREELCAYRSLLKQEGHAITSRWLDGNHQISDAGLNEREAEAERIRFATEDWQDLHAAEACISFTEEPRSTSSRGGRHVEFGAALSLGMKCVVVGPRENVFHCIPAVEHFDTWGDFITSVYFAEWKREA